MSDYNSKITGATEFSYLSAFSEVDRAKENLKQRFVDDIFNGFR